MKKLTPLQQLLASFVLIVGASMTMHVLVFSKRQDRGLRSQPVFDNRPAQTQFIEQGAPLDGKVIAVGVDRFYLETGTRRIAVLFGQAPHPDAGDHLRVFYFQGDPPTALKTEKL